MTESATTAPKITGCRGTWPDRRGKAVDRRLTARVVADGGLDGLDAKRWAKVLAAAAVTADPTDAVAAELRRRIRADDVAVPNLVALLDAGQSWALIRGEVFDWAAGAHFPDFASLACRFPAFVSHGRCRGPATSEVGYAHVTTRMSAG
ncbi:hypothetical protein EEB14_48445 [Rhodococcus sp. WS4]|nr:hypothetical protein EEB14_48445 [Rhodococcus sp. WS4]